MLRFLKFGDISDDGAIGTDVNILIINFKRFLDNNEIKYNKINYA